jgi:NADH:ubiquinone oxidoreductase subunit 3 (subunit A)
LVDALLSPPVAFLLYIPLVMLLLWFGRQLAGPANPSEAKSSSYGSGEKAPSIAAAPGYKPFFLVAFFFAILHLGILVLGVGNLSGPQAVFIVGLGLALVALILG